MSRRIRWSMLAASGLFVFLWLLILIIASATASPVQIVRAEALPVPAQQQADFQAFLPVHRTLGDPFAPLCRLGVNNSIAGLDMTRFRIGWYQDYEANVRARQPNGVKYTPVVRLSPDTTNPKGYRYSIKPNWGQTTEAELLAAIDAFPGAYWHIGNEPDRPNRARGRQDAIAPELYARAYHDLYHLIKSRDSTAKIVAGNIVQPTILRLQYLDLVLKAYHEMYDQAMPVDVWGIHNFVLNEASCEHYRDAQGNVDLNQCWGAEIPPGVNAVDGLRIGIPQVGSLELFKEQILRFRQWLADRGYRGAPVHLSEYGILVGPPDRSGYLEFPFSVVNQYMKDTFDYMLTATDPQLGDPADGYRLIQRFSWYSVRDVEFGGFLFEPLESNPREYKLSPAGETYIAYAATLEEEVDFVPVKMMTDPPAPLRANGATTVTVSALIGNAGNTNRPHSAVVRFYNGDPARNGQQIGQDQIVSLAGCGDNAIAQVEWTDVPPGAYRLFVVVDPQQTVSETVEDNNRLSMNFFFAEEQIFVPAARHLPPP